MFRRILVPVDFTKKNLRAVRLAVKLAASRRAQVTLLHVIERVDAGDPGALEGFYRKLESNARQKMKGLLAGAKGAFPKAEVRYGNRVNEILNYISEQKVDLVVMSSHKLAIRHPGENWGTISYKIGILSRCPVLLVK
jgi:nucleotide-binding universal stress UspA family protein